MISLAMLGNDNLGYIWEQGVWEILGNDEPGYIGTEFDA